MNFVAPNVTLIDTLRQEVSYMKKLIAEEYKRFENIKQIREDGS